MHRIVTILISFLTLLGLLPGGGEARAVTVTAHSGAMLTIADTLWSVKAALSCGAEIIEVDVRFLPDGTPALGHDEVGPNSVPLEAVFREMQAYPAMGINLDMKQKQKAQVERVAALVTQYGLEGRAFMTSVMPWDVAALRDCGLPYYVNSTDVQAALELGALGINIHYEDCTGALVQSAHELGLLVSVWTVDRPSAMRDMLRMGVDNITTNMPILLQLIIQYDNRR